MKIVKTFFAIVLLAVFAISCSNDASESQTRKNLLLKETDTNDNLISTYKYDSNNRLINYKLNGNEMNAPRNYDFTYNVDGTLNKITKVNQGIILYTFSYDSNKKIIKKEDNINIFIYTYDGNVITENYKNLMNETGWRNVYTYDTKGNITNLKIYSDTSNANPLGTYSGIINYTYDNKINAKSSLPEAFNFPGSVNNIMTTQYNEGPVSSFSYEYNSDNYPVKVINDFVTYEYQQL